MEYGSTPEKRMKGKGSVQSKAAAGIHKEEAEHTFPAAPVSFI